MVAATFPLDDEDAIFFSLDEQDYEFRRIMRISCPCFIVYQISSLRVDFNWTSRAKLGELLCLQKNNIFSTVHIIFCPIFSLNSFHYANVSCCAIQILSLD